MDERRRTGSEERPMRKTSGTRTQAGGRTSARRSVSDGVSDTETVRRTRPQGRGDAGTAKRTADPYQGGERRAAASQSAERRSRTAPSSRAPQSSRKTAQVARNSSSGRPPGAGRRKNTRRRRKMGLFLKVFLVFVLLAGILGGTFLWTRYGPSKEKYDLDKYFGIESAGQIGVTVNNEVVGPMAMQVDGQVYLSYETVRDYLNSRFYWDANENILLYTLPTEMVSAGVGSNSYTVSKETKNADYVILKTEGSTAYIALEFVKQYTDIEYKLYKDPDRVMIVGDWSDTKTATVKRDTEVRLKGGVKSPILAPVSKGDKVTVIEDESDWKKVRTADGVIGYIKKTKLRKTETEAFSRDFQEPVFTNIKKDYTINLAWHQVTSQTANSGVLETIASTKGLTTISPTWFTVADNSGNLTSIASTEYVNYAHQSGLEVWALVDNFGENIDQMELLSRTSARENLENQLISAAIQSGIDGINVDFEQIGTDVGEHYIQFIRELSVKCRLNNLVLSVDNYVPKGFNAHYQRKEQGIVADYVIIMGYDEHYSGSYEAGSVASYNYVKEGIEETIKDVPADKVINAVPFYTRLWRMVPKTEEELAEQAGTEAADYPMNVTSEAMGMAEAARRISEAGAEITWDDTVKQNYAEWTDADGAVYKIWIEDATSLEEKLKLMKEFKLAGTAAWKLGFENSDIWELIVKYVN